MKIDFKGTTRIVILIGKYAIKIPNFLYQHNHFLYGCYANCSERRHNITFKGREELQYVAPSYFCSWFGLLQIQARCEPKLNDLTQEEIDFYENLHQGDFKKENFGYYKGILVCLDYP